MAQEVARVVDVAQANHGLDMPATYPVEIGLADGDLRLRLVVTSAELVFATRLVVTSVELALLACRRLQFGYKCRPSLDSIMGYWGPNSTGAAR